MERSTALMPPPHSELPRAERLNVRVTPEQERQKIIDQVHQILFRSVLKGEFDKSNLNFNCKYQTVRDAMTSNRRLLGELSPLLEELFTRTQAESKKQMGSEKFPGQKVKKELLYQEIFNHSETIEHGDTNYVSKSFTEAAEKPGSVIIVLNHAQNSGVTLDQNKPRNVNELGFSLLLKERRMIEQFVLASASRRFNSPFSNQNRRNALLRSLDKKIGHDSQKDQDYPFPSRFQAWFDLCKSLTSTNDGYIKLTKASKRHLYEEMKFVTMDLLLQKLVSDIIAKPYLTIVQVGGNHPLRTQLINELGQGVDTTGFFLDPNFIKNPTAEALTGYEFLGLVDSGNFQDIKTHIKSMLGYSNRTRDYFIKLINLLSETGLISSASRSEGNNFTSDIISTIIRSAYDKPFFEGVIGHLLSKSLISRREKRELLGQ